MANNLGTELPFRWMLDDGLSAVRWCSVLRKDGKFIRKQCMHCLQPACVSACPVAALRKTPEGSVIYDSKRCIGCRYCMMACPFGIPRYDWESAVPYVRKCQMCWHDRVSKGTQPGCTAGCPVGATIFGERDELLAEAHKRITDNPDRYLPTVFGEKEVGGTSVLYLSPQPLDILTLGNKLDERPLPGLTAPAMNAVPVAFVGMGVLMTGIWWVIERRMKAERDRMAKEGRLPMPAHGEEHVEVEDDHDGKEG
jgi:formate dehydrogenase iron-sulfur subunit